MTISNNKIKFNKNKVKKLDLNFTKSDVLKTKRQIRATEYYGLQDLFDKLYKDSSNGKKFTNLMEIICSEDNILLAYRNLKSNKGGRTPGVDGYTIQNLKDLSTEELIKRVRDKLQNYQAKPVKRVYIPKTNGKLRPLGIPCIMDRLVQQCIKQVMEPICEAKFHPMSYGFRPQRQAQHAINEFMRNVNLSKNHYVVDVDIKGFFDNVNHSKLLKQIWNLGIQDKNLLCVIKKCLLAPIEEENNGVKTVTHPTKGTPQGGILSPLLANIVLNELDWWISNQWATYKTKYNYDVMRKDGSIINSNRYRAMRRSKLKEGYLIRYADDFKICCRTKEDAEKWYHATTQWLQERLGLEYAPDKSKITNLKKSSSEFLGFRFKLKPKKGKWVLNSHMTQKAKETMIKDIVEQVKRIQRNTNVKNVNILNAKILGRHNYYKLATHINLDMTEIAHKVSKCMHNRLSGSSKKIKKSKRKGKNIYDVAYTKTYDKFYGNYNYKPLIVCNTPIFPIGGIKHESPKGFSREITPYTEKGREKIHSNLECVEPWQLKYIIMNPIENMSAEYNDNRVSLFTAQWGACGLTGYPLNVREMECHHKIPKSKGGTDEFNNLIMIGYDAHKLIHATQSETIEKYLTRCKNLMEICVNKNPNKFFEKLNILREAVGNQPIIAT